LNFAAVFASVAALSLLCGHGTKADETTAWITERDVGIERITLSNGQIFSVPSTFPSALIKVGSLVRVTFVVHGEDDDEKKVTNIVLVFEDPAGTGQCQDGGDEATE
jgi:hypothetical protein